MAKKGSWERLGVLYGSIPGLPVAVGLNPSASFVWKFGANRDIDILSVPESVWSGGGLYPWQASAVVLEVISDDPTDDGDPVAAGARTVEVQGLDANWAMQTETLTMNGVGAVAIPGTWLRVLRAKVITAGATGTNAGTILVRIESAGATLAIIEPGLGQTTMAIYTIPLGYTGYLVQVRSGIMRSVPTTVYGTIAVFERDNAIADAAFQMKSENAVGITTVYSAPRPITEKTDIDLRVPYVSADNAQVVAELDIILVDNT